MSLYRRSETWHYDFSMAGQRYRGSTKETVLCRARKVEALLMAEARDRGPAMIPKRAPILRDFANRFFEWVETSQLEPASKLYYRNGWRMIRETLLAGMQLDRITADQVQAVQFQGSPANTNKALRTFRRMLGKAAEWGVIRVVPRVRLAKEHGRSLLIDPETEVGLLAVATQPLRDVLVIMLDTGMRPQEVFRLRWEHVNWELGTILVPYGKTKSSRRHVPISQRVRDALLARKVEREGWVFPAHSRAGHLTTVAKAFAEARQKANVSSEVVLYCARHTFATHALAATGNLAAVMKALGHSSVQTAMIYQHPSLEAIRQAIDSRNLAQAERHNSRHNPELVN
jgi:integrase